MEYCRYGDLSKYLKLHRSLPVDQVQHLAHQIVEGLHQMHQNDFAHRDLKPGVSQDLIIQSKYIYLSHQNILIKGMPPKEQWWAVLADFGISKRADDKNAPTTTKGTSAFMAPELLGYIKHQKPKVIADYKAADMWSLGEIIFQLLTGENTFTSPVDLMHYCKGSQKYPSERLPQSISVDGFQFIVNLMAPLSKNRITAAQSIRHRWMTSSTQQEEGIPNLERGTMLEDQHSNSQLASARWSALSHTDVGLATRLPWANEMTAETQSIDGESWSSGLDEGSGLSLVMWTRNTIKKALEVPKVDTGDDLYYSTPPSRRHWNLKRIMMGHDDIITNMCFTPDSSYIASSSYDRTVRLWNIAAGQPIAIYKQRHVMKFVAFSQYGNIRTSASTKMSWGAMYERSHSLWNAESRELVHQFSPRSMSSHLTPEGAWLHSAISDQVAIYDAETGGKVQHVGCPLRVESALSWDARKLAIMTKDDLTLWNVDTGNKEHKIFLSHHSLRSFAQSLKCLEFSPDGKWILCGYSRRIWIYDVNTGEQRVTFKDSRLSNFYSVSFSPDGRMLGTTSRENGKVYVWDVDNGRLQQTLKLPVHNHCGVVFSPCNKWLAVASTGRHPIKPSLQLWEMEPLPEEENVTQQVV